MRGPATTTVVPGLMRIAQPARARRASYGVGENQISPRAVLNRSELGGRPPPALAPKTWFMNSLPFQKSMCDPFAPKQRPK